MAPRPAHHSATEGSLHLLRCLADEGIMEAGNSGSINDRNDLFTHNPLEVPL